MGLAVLAMVTSPTGKGVIAMGGYSSGGFSKAMFELTQSMEWTRLEQTLQIDHWAPLVTPLPDELVKKKSWRTVLSSVVKKSNTVFSPFLERKTLIRVGTIVATTIIIINRKNVSNWVIFSAGALVYFL